MDRCGRRSGRLARIQRGADRRQKIARARANIGGIATTLQPLDQRAADDHRIGEISDGQCASGILDAESNGDRQLCMPTQ